MKKKLAENSGAEPARKGRGPGRPFKAGASGNPGGRPKEERDVVEALRLAGVELAEKLLELARAGNVKAIEVALNRAYGKARERVELGPPPPLPWSEILAALPEEQREQLRKHRDQIEAVFAASGRSLQVVALPGAAAPARDFDASLLTEGEVDEMIRIQEKATGVRTGLTFEFRLAGKDLEAVQIGPSTRKALPSGRPDAVASKISQGRHIAKERSK